METKRMPSVFIGHGSPMNVVLDNKFTRSLSELGKKLPRPEAVLSVSAHWMTEKTMVVCDEENRQIYDFFGFPRELYEYEYHAKGAPGIAESIISRLSDCSISCGKWGLDHGSWAVLKWIYPKADVPIVQISLDYRLSTQEHLDIGKKLSFLRNEGVLILGSGNIVHNLSMIKMDMDSDPFPWALEFDGFIARALEKKDLSKLVNYNQLGDSAALSVPTDEHYLPMLYSVGSMSEGEKLRFIYEGFQHSSISMRSFIVE